MTTIATRPHRIRCGDCYVGHGTVAEVVACHMQALDEQATIEAERASEAAAERYWEEGTEAQQIQASFEAEEEARHCWR